MLLQLYDTRKIMEQHDTALINLRIKFLRNQLTGNNGYERTDGYRNTRYERKRNFYPDDDVATEKHEYVRRNTNDINSKPCEEFISIDNIKLHLLGSYCWSYKRKSFFC